MQASAQKNALKETTRSTDELGGDLSRRSSVGLPLSGTATVVAATAASSAAGGTTAGVVAGASGFGVVEAEDRVEAEPVPKNEFGNEFFFAILQSQRSMT